MPLIRERNGVYYADEWIIDSRTKRRKRIRRSSGTRDYDEAREWYAKIASDLWRQKKLGERPVHSWAEAVVEYMRGRERRPSYSQDLRRIAWIDAHLGNLLLPDIDVEVLRAIRRAHASTAKRNGSTVGAATTNRVMTFVRAVLNHARKLKWLADVPEIDMLEVPERKPVYLEADEVDALIAELQRAPRTRHLVDFVVLAVDCGLRMRNVTHLKWSDIDVQRRSVWIEKANTKGNRHIAIPLTDAAFEVIQRNMGRHLVYVLTHRGKPYDRVNPRTLRAAAARVGVAKRITPHTLRHTFATRLIHRGVSLFELMELGGWSKIESVQIYTHFSPERLRETVNRGSHFSRRMDGPPKLAGDERS